MSTDVIDFIKKDESECVDFEISKHGETKSGNKFIRFNAHFRFGKNTFFSTYWKPGGEDEISERNIKALVFISHGFAEYLNYSYEEVARYWATKLGSDEDGGGGCLVFGHDHVGHGRSSGKRAGATKMQEYVNPIIAHIEAVKEWYPGDEELPVYLVGHSMGALISLFLLFECQSMFSGFVALTPLVDLDTDMISPIKRFLAVHSPALCSPLQLGSFSCELMTRDIKKVKRIKKDNLFWHGGTTSGHDGLLISSCEVATDNLFKITIPLLVFQGEKDEYENPEGAKMMFEEVASVDKDFITYPEACHHLLIELEEVKLDVFNKTLQWMSQRLS